MPLLVIFIIIPVIEIWLLIKVGGAIGTLPTVGLIILTAIIGVALLKQQSMATVANAREKLATGSMPVSQMVEGIFLAVGGALLLTPGFFTDAIGFACLIPGIRQVLIGWAASKIKFQPIHPQGPGAGKPQDKDSRTIEGEYTREP